MPLCLKVLQVPIHESQGLRRLVIIALFTDLIKETWYAIEIQNRDKIPNYYPILVNAEIEQPHIHRESGAVAGVE